MKRFAILLAVVSMAHALSAQEPVRERIEWIHFNNGLHGWGYTEDQYRDGLMKTVAAVNEHAGDAKLIWATTTPVREKSDLETFNEKSRSSQSAEQTRR